jgi:ABC-2 type transport system ATP-binding protein
MSNTSDIVLNVNGIEVIYNHVILVLKGVSLSVSEGSIVALLGGNGAGKTTTIAMILGLITPTSGSIRVLGAEMPRQRYHVLGRMNFESPYVDMPHRLTVRQNLTVFGRLYNVAGLAERIAGLADDLDLTEFIDRPVGKLSSGQKTRVALAKALINAPDVLLLDEPTASLDAENRDVVIGMIRDAKARGAALAGIFHDPAVREAVADSALHVAPLQDAA